ncbi:MAG: hypothetical protein AB1444_04100 [Spirochaetota bacterium]
MKRHTVLIIAIMVIATIVSCSYENTATVTIDTGIRQQAHLNWFGRVLALLSFSQPLQADPVPGLPYSITQIKLFIKASDMETIEESIPLDTGKITLEVPAGSQRTFEVVGYDESGYRYYGGITTVDLSPGQEVNLNIEMGELFDFTRYDGSASYYQSQNQIIITAYTQINPNVIAFKLYRKPVGSNFAEEYYTTLTNIQFTMDQYSITYTIPATLDLNYNYLILSVTRYGESDRRQLNIY